MGQDIVRRLKFNATEVDKEVVKPAGQWNNQLLFMDAAWVFSRRDGPLLWGQPPAQCFLHATYTFYSAEPIGPCLQVATSHLKRHC